MLTITKHLETTSATARAVNLAEEMEGVDLVALGAWVWDGYEQDEASRGKWLQRTSAAMDLAMQVVAAKSFPWPNASNVAFPLVTIAALQFHARAYPSLIAGTQVVKMRTPLGDAKGQLKKLAQEVSLYMSYQVLEEDEAWEEETDRALLSVPIVGCAFKKSYYSPTLGHNVSDLVLAKDLVMDYWAKSVETCARKTHTLPKYRNEIYENVKRGLYCDILEESWFQEPAQTLGDAKRAAEDKRAGRMPSQPSEITPFTLLEQHCSVDLDGDGYAEPYIITIEYFSKTVLRVVARWDREEDIERNSKQEIIRITPREYFTKIPFIPSPDGGVYDMGFGVLLGPLNESVSTIVNQLIDAGTMATTAGGFLGRGAKIRGGSYTFAPLEWKRVDATGDDLRKSIVPLQVREPSTVLFQLLSLLINYAQRIPGSTDTLSGENPGQNTPAETNRSMVEQGMKIYSAIFKRIWRGFKKEFQKLYILNSIYFPLDGVKFGEETITRQHFSLPTKDICPAADPNLVSEGQRFMKAQMLKQAAMTTAGYDLVAVEHNYLDALQVDGKDALYLGPDKVPPLPNPKAMVEQLKTQREQMKLQAAKEEFLMGLMEERRLNNAKIIELEAKAANEMAQAGGVETGHKVALFEAAVGAAKSHNDFLNKRIELMLKSLENQDGPGKEGNVQQLVGPPGNPGAHGQPAGGQGLAPGAMGSGVFHG